MRIRTLVGSLLAGGLLLTAMVPLLAHAQTGTPARAAITSDQTRHDPQLDQLRRATDRFHSIAVAEQNGYGLLLDVDKIACIDMPPMPGMRGMQGMKGMPATGAMGVHWAKGALVGDGKIDPNQPESMVYAPGRDGTLTLAAVEYVVLKADWDAKHRYAPVLFGHRFATTDAPNRFGLPAFYSLHVWAWKHNPAGTFEMFNPNVVCPA
jgi:hypothetical protein